jgi:2'-5' RNA ligase
MLPEPLIRCFISLHVPEEIVTGISQYIQELKKLTTGVKWIRPEGIHLTLKFLGEIESSRVKMIESRLPEISKACAPFNIYVSGSGCFPGRKKPRVFWVGLEQGESNPLLGIHVLIENILEPLGFDKEKRRFSPHLTLGRVKHPANFLNIYTFFDKHPFPKINFHVTEFFFMRSELKPSGAEYSVIGRYPLKGS